MTIFDEADKLVSEFDALQNDIRGTARLRQIAIGKELASWKFPPANDMQDYSIGQDTGRVELDAKQGGQYYPDWMQEADEKQAYRWAIEEGAEQTMTLINQLRDVTDHPDYDPADFEGKCCNGTGLIEVNGDVETCPVCDAILKKYKAYLPSPVPADLGDEIPF